MDKPTIATLAALIGRQGTVRAGMFLVNVKVKDIKQSYGEIRYLVTPDSGHGEAWVTSATFRLDDKTLKVDMP